ncbi:GTP-binding protein BRASSINAZOLE INSENSITIVE PALE GREEN 2, chloroplastic isoform X2 [Durio zibethinus]|uniref:GTP-binding protein BRASSINAZOLE INSENSITIVE PALE GREEN 2, chloroplastic isoform X2 n=1 Tax=Durio zibethinus TaxID=66656 RepID=A0A6P5YRC9_DURZI|nr:GTP-binding protein BRASSINAZOLE INSENSITIVE PALE GREEN 2, chloroplastic isoform X2 [Durio zibethinus]
MAFLLSTRIVTLSPKLHDTTRTIQENPETTLCFFPGLGDKKNRQNRVSTISLAVKNQSFNQTTEKIHGKITRRRGKNPVWSEGRDEDENYGAVCPGCGVFMQDKDPNLPGYYQKRKVIDRKVVQNDDGDDMEEYFEDELEGLEENFVDDIEGKFEGSDAEEDNLVEGDEFDWDSDEWEAKFIKGEDGLEFDGFAPASVGYGNITEEIMEKGKRKRLSKAERKRMARKAKDEKEEVTVCARCHSLRNYGQVKNQSVENLIPDFDFDRLIATRLIKPTGNASATVVVIVVDCVDFDGSFPKRAAKPLFKLLEEAQNDPKLSKKLPKLVLVATKVDLLPSQISPTRLDRWVRHRAKAGGAPKLNGVYLVSSRKDLGVKNLLAFIKELAGPRGNVWVIGAQNAGKSTLINAFAKKEKANITRLTEAPVPGTTLGILRIGGILSAKAKMYDTPGLLHPYLMSMRLNRDEQKMVEIRKELKPRTYRMKVGQAVHVGGLMRLDLNHASVETIYVTVWASPNVSLHMGKVENADEIWKNHVGFRLQPPIGEDRSSELGKWEEREVKVSGSSWDVNCIDVAAAGLGWFSLGFKGEATLALWTYDGIEITLREPLVLDRAPFLERPGFWLPKAISDAIGNQNKLEPQKRKNFDESADYLS